MAYNDLKKPFIKKFKVDNDCYVFDVNTNRILKLDKISYDISGEFEDDKIEKIVEKFKHLYQESDILKSIEGIKEARKKEGVFSNFRPEKVTYGIESTSQIKKILDSKLNQIILEITNNCNLGCKYCSASGEYADHKCHTNNDMTIETAKKAVDFFIENNKNAQYHFIGFYGGEPLLRFDLIKEVVKFVKNKTNLDYTFSLTTNGTLFNKEIVSFFVKNDISILISLDGPKDLHDRYRVFKDGKGTFDTIIENLKMIKKYDKKYFSDKVSFNCVIAPPYEIGKTTDFFSNNDIFKIPGGISYIRPSFVRTEDTSFIEDFNLAEFEKERATAYNKLLNRLKNAFINKHYEQLNIEKEIFFSAFYNIARRPMSKKPGERIPHFGACFMGLRRVYVSPSGDFFICERGGTYDYKIGDTRNGFDYDTMVDFYLKFDSIFADCKNCWALLHCERCFASAGDIKSLTGEKKANFCAARRATIERHFQVYCEILNENPDAFQVVKDAVVV